MPNPIENRRFLQLVQQIDPHYKLLRIWNLAGGVSAQVTALEVALSDGQTKKLVVRQHGAADLRRNPNIAADEFKLLQTLHSASLPVPAPVYVDSSSETFATPCIVVEFVDGTTEFAPSNLPDHLRQLAQTLAQIHAVDPTKVDLSFLPQDDERYARTLREIPDEPDESLQETRIREVFGSSPPPILNKPSLLHGDYWSGNVLWKDEKLVAVIDWEDAMIGDPIADLANTRLEILWAFGIDAMHTFTQHYQSIMTALDTTHLPYWELLAALRKAPAIGTWDVDAATEQRMRERVKWFVEQAFEGLLNEQS